MMNKRSDLPIRCRWTVAVHALALIVVMGFTAVAWAEPQSQEAAPAESGQSTTSTDDGLEEVMVTARRRDERAQTVPMTVTALSGDQLASQSVTKLSDLTQTVPALQVVPSAFSANTPKFTIRSQSQYEPLLTEDPSVTVYFADVIQERASGLNSQMYDLASVEVLKGPQGTLFGRNSTGGDILFQPQLPTKDFDVQADASVGNYALTSIDGILNLPVNDVLQVRFDASLLRHRGYTRDVTTGVDLDDAHKESWRFGALLSPSDSFTNSLFLTGFTAQEHGSALQITGNDPAGLQQLAYPQVQSYLQLQQSLPFHTVLSVPQAPDHVETFLVADTATWNLGVGTIKNIFGYRRVTNSEGFDFDGTPLSIFVSQEGTNERQYSDELQFLGTSLDKHLDWIGGLYWFKEYGYETQHAILNYAQYLQQSSDQTGYVTNLSRSVFAQGTYRLPGYEALSFTVGGRFTSDRRDLTATAQNEGQCAIFLDNAETITANPCYQSAGKTFTSPTWQAGVDWQLTSEQLLYFTASKGYKSGGYNLRAQTPAEFTPYYPETVTQEELGLKADWHPGGTALRSNLALYYQSYNNIQRTEAAIIDGGLVTTLVNAATATVKGIEADVTWLPLKTLELRAYWSYSDAGYSKWEVPNGSGGFSNYSDNAFAYSPRNSGGGSARQSFPLPGTAGTLVAGIDGYHRTTIQLQDINVLPWGLSQAYTIGNLRFEWNEIMNSGVSTAIFVRNFTNTHYYTAGTPVSGLGSTVKALGEPLTYGIEFHYRLKH